jgi:hypothetical protein
VGHIQLPFFLLRSPPANLQSVEFALKSQQNARHLNVQFGSTYNFDHPPPINSITHQPQWRKNMQRSRVALNRLVRSYPSAQIQIFRQLHASLKSFGRDCRGDGMDVSLNNSASYISVRM